jgi:hypothetical protein
MCADLVGHRQQTLLLQNLGLRQGMAETQAVF